MPPVYPPREEQAYQRPAGVTAISAQSVISRLVSPSFSDGQMHELNEEIGDHTPAPSENP